MQIIQNNREFDNLESILNFKLYNPNTSFRSLAETYLENINSLSARKVSHIVRNPVITWDKIQSPELIGLRIFYFENPNCQFEREIIKSVRSTEGYNSIDDEDITIMKNIDKVVRSNNLDEDNPETWLNFMDDLHIEWVQYVVSELIQSLTLEMILKYQVPPDPHEEEEQDNPLFDTEYFCRFNPNAKLDILMKEVELPKSIILKLFMSNPNLTWDIVWKHRKEIGNLARTGLVINTFGRSLSIRKKQERETIISEYLPTDLSKK